MEDCFSEVLCDKVAGEVCGEGVNDSGGCLLGVREGFAMAEVCYHYVVCGVGCHNVLQ